MIHETILDPVVLGQIRRVIQEAGTRSGLVLVFLGDDAGLPEANVLAQLDGADAGTVKGK